MADLILDGAPFTPRVAREQGIGRRQLRTLLATGTVRTLARGVLVDASVPDTLPLRALALSHVLPPGTVAAGTTAAWLHGIDHLVPGADRRPPPIHVVRPLDSAAVRREGIRGQVAVLPASDVTMSGSIPVLTPARTAVDLARELDRCHGLAYVDAFLRLGCLREHMEAVLAGMRGCPWVEQGRELVEMGDGRAESPGESWLRLRWNDARLPRLELQISLREDGREIYRLDAGLPAIRFGAEYDGEADHGPAQAQRDADRRRWIEAQGWMVEAFRADAVLGRGWGFETIIAERTGLVPELVPWQLRQRTYAHRRRRQNGWATVA